MKVTLKEGLSTIGNKYFELKAGSVSEIDPSMFNGNVMVEVGVNSENFRQELIDLNGIGEKTADLILAFAKSKKELAEIPRQFLIDELRDDYVEILDEYLGR